MIDEKKIEEAKKSFIADKKILGVMAMNDLACGFKEGAKWAINEFLKDLWHPVSEEPAYDKKILVQYTNYMVEDDYEIDMNSPHVPWRYIVTTYNLKKWCYIEDLLPKGGEK